MRPCVIVSVGEAGYECLPTFVSESSPAQPGAAPRSQHPGPALFAPLMRLDVRILSIPLTAGYTEDPRGRASRTPPPSFFLLAGSSEQTEKAQAAYFSSVTTVIPFFGRAINCWVAGGPKGHKGEGGGQAPTPVTLYTPSPRPVRSLVARGAAARSP